MSSVSETDQLMYESGLEVLHFNYCQRDTTISQRRSAFCASEVERLSGGP